MDTAFPEKVNQACIFTSTWLSNHHAAAGRAGHLVKQQAATLSYACKEWDTTASATTNSICPCYNVAKSIKSQAAHRFRSYAINPEPMGSGFMA